MNRFANASDVLMAAAEVRNSQEMHRHRRTQYQADVAHDIVGSQHSERL